MEISRKSLVRDTARLRWNLGNGRIVRFWWTCWVTKRQPLISYVLGPVPNNIIHTETADFVDSDGYWQWDFFGQLIPSNILLCIGSIQPPGMREVMTESFGKNQQMENSLPIILFLIPPFIQRIRFGTKLGGGRDHKAFRFFFG